VRRGRFPARIKAELEERIAKRDARDMQGWQRRQPLTCRAATHSRDGRPYERLQHGQVVKGIR